MFLNFLETKAQKGFFMNFATLVALANGDKTGEDDLLKKSSIGSDHLMKFFQDTQNVFPMCQSEFRFLKKSSEEMRFQWEPLNKQDNHYWKSLSAISEIENALLARLMAEMPDDTEALKDLPKDDLRDKAIRNRIGEWSYITEVLRNSVGLVDPSFQRASNGGKFNPAEVFLNISKQLLENRVDAQKPEAQKPETQKLKKFRNVMLWIAFITILSDDARKFPAKVKRAMLFEATQTAYADGVCSPEEDLLLHLFCRHLDIDMGLIDEFKVRSKKISDLYSECLEIVNE
jgi:hypothetical protein